MDGFLNLIKDEWQKRRVIFISELISFVTGLGAAVYQAFTLRDVNYFLYYGSYTISAITAIISSIGRRSIPLLVANVGYLCLDVFALLNQFKKVRSAALVSGLLLRLALQN